MSTKYVKLTADHSDWESALYSMKPRQIRRLSDDEARAQHWFPVKESFQPSPDRDLYRNVVSSWEIVNGFVEVSYVPELIYLNGRRDVMATRVHELRERKLRGGIIVNGVEFDTQTETYQRVTGAVLSVMLDETFTTDWIAADNSTVTLDGPAIIELGKALASFEAANIMFARDLKDAILVSNEPETFQIDEGWPSNVYGTTPTAQ